MLTDDETDSEDEGRSQRPGPSRRETRLFQPKPVLNRILESGSSSSLPGNADSNSQQESVKRNPSSQPVFSSSSKDPPESNCNPSDTVIGSFSDEDLCSQLDEMKVKDKIPRKNPPPKETVEGPFSDVSLSDRPVTQVRNKLRDTVIFASSDESDYDDMPPPSLRRPPPKREQRKKESLPDTIIGFSESMSSLSLGKMPSHISEEDEPAADVANESEGSEEAEVITIPDSEEEALFKDCDQPPVLKSSDSFQNCSSIGSSKKTAESDSTMNRFFNNPPSIRSSQIVVTHSVIQRHKELPVEESEANHSRDRFNAEVVEDDEEEIVLNETDASLDKKSEASENDSEAENEPRRTQTVAKVSSESQTLTQSSVNENISLSARINISLKITMRDPETSSSSDADSSSSAYEPSSTSSESEDSQPQQRKNATTKRTPVSKATPSKQETPRANTPKQNNHSGRKEKQGALQGSGAKPSNKFIENPLLTVQTPEGFKTPVKSNDVPIIDEDLQAVLDSLYGETWKTPQLLRSCKSKTVRQDLRKSIFGNNFEACKFNFSSFMTILINCFSYSCEEFATRL